MRRPHRHDDRGQAAVEFALALPLVVVVVLVVAQIGLVVRDEIAVQHAAREGARAAAVSADPAGAATAAVTTALTRSAQVDVVMVGERVSVTVTTAGATSLPIVGALLPSVTHSATATMVLEPP